MNVKHDPRQLNFKLEPQEQGLIDRKRFVKLVEEAGFKIVKYRQHILYANWRFYFKGFRSTLRLLFGTYFHQYYELRKK